MKAQFSVGADGANSKISLQVGLFSSLRPKKGTTRSGFAKVASASEHMLQVVVCAAADDSMAMTRTRERVKIFMF